MNIFLKQVFWRKNLVKNLTIEFKPELEWIDSGVRISALRQVLPSDARHCRQRQGREPCVSRPRV